MDKQARKLTTTYVLEGESDASNEDSEPEEKVQYLFFFFISSL